MAADEKPAASAEGTVGADEATSGAEGKSGTTNVSKLTPLVERLKTAGSGISDFAKGLAAVPGLEKLSAPLMQLSGFLGKAGETVSDVVKSVEENKSKGGVSVALGIADTLLGAISGGDGASDDASGGTEGGDGSQSGGAQSFIEKAKAKVAELKKIWDSYYEELFDKDKKLNLLKAANLAAEVGTVILGSKKMAKVRKALSIANVVRNTAEAVMVAAKSAPLPFNLPAIAQAVALGAAQLGTVKGQAHDGINNIPSTGTYLLERGERVVDSRLNTDLTGFLKGQTAGGNNTNSTNIDRRVDNSRINNRSQASSVTNAPVINVSVGAGADENAVSNNRGAMETMIREIFADYAMEAPFA